MIGIFHQQFRVYYEDTDAGGVVYHANYLKFFDRTRTEWLRSKGLEQSEMAVKENIILAIRHIDIDFIKPARLDDLLTAYCQPTCYKKVSMMIHQEMYRDDELLAKAAVKVVSLKADLFKPTKFPQHLIQELMN